MLSNQERQAEYVLLLRYLEVMKKYLLTNFDLEELQDISEIIARLNKSAERNPALSIEAFLDMFYADDPEVNLATTQVLHGCNKYIKDKNIMDVVPINISKPGSNMHWQTISESVASAARIKYFAENPDS